MKEQPWFSLKQNRPPQNTKVYVHYKDNVEGQAVLMYNIKEDVLYWKVEENVYPFEDVLFWSHISPTMMRDVCEYEHI